MNSLPISGATKSVSFPVNERTLTEAHDQARLVSRSLHRIESLAELDWEELNWLCRASQQTESLLQEMLNATEAACKAAR